VITPAAGFVTATSSVIIGIVAGIVPFLAVAYLKKAFGYDDALDTFGVHAVGGTLGALLTGLLATAAVNGNLSDANSYAKTNGLAKLVGEGGLFGQQVMAVLVTLVLSILMTTIIAFALKAILGLRPTPEIETGGLDINEHGEEGYIL
jgi:Amt family ammonium transporter